MTSPHRHIRIADRVTTRLKLKQLRLLVAIASHASLVGAAREMNISQPAATKLLKDLEDDFDVRLFERTNRAFADSARAPGAGADFQRRAGTR